jgi:N-acyl-L-homoserine lactone synthetase
MIHICSSRNRHLYAAQLAEMHRQRYELFVKGRGWNLLVRGGGEYDDGDDDRAVYLLSIDQTGHCFGSIRVRPADDFSMVIDRMPHHVDGDARALRADPGLWEMARWINIGNDPSAGQEIRIGLIEYLRQQGATQCLALPDAHMMAYGIRTGWRLRALGGPKPYPEGGVAVAVSLPITDEEVIYLRELTGRRDHLLLEIDPTAPWAPLPLPTIEAAHRSAAERGFGGAEIAVIADETLRRTAVGELV